MRVLILEDMPIDTSNYKKLGYSVDFKFNQTEASLADIIGDYNIIFIYKRKDLLTAEVLKSANRLHAIGIINHYSSGQVDLDTAKEMGIPVFLARYQHQASVAELNISFMIMLARQLGDRSKEIHQGNWQKTSNDCHEVRGKTLGLVGYGHVGSYLGILGEALSMKVLYYDVSSPMPIGQAQACDSLDELLAASDFVSVNVSTFPENINMISRTQILKMKPKSYLLNTSFGKAVDHDAVKEFIENGHLQGAAFDVYPSNYEKEFKSPLIGLRNVILSPQYARATVEATERICSEVQGSIQRYLDEGTTLGAVNFPSVIAWPLKPGDCRIISIHRDYRGILKEILNILSSHNVERQIWETAAGIGYLIVDVAGGIETDIAMEMASLANTVRMRIINNK